MRKIIALLTCMLIFGEIVEGRNLKKEVRAAIKSGSNLEQMENDLLTAIPNEEKQERRAEYYYYAALINQKINDIENEKLYLKQSYDTVKFFNSIHTLYRRLYQCDSVERIRAERGLKYKYRSKSRNLLRAYRVNLLNGGKFFLIKHDYPNAFAFLDMYLESALWEIFEKDNYIRTDSVLYQVARWATLSAFNMNSPENTIKHADLALRENNGRNYIYEYKAKAYLALGDTTNWLKTLKAGLTDTPNHPFFFANLMDYLNATGHYDEAIDIADRMIDFQRNNAFYWYAKSLALLNKKDYEACIAISDSVLVRNPDYADAYYNKGISYCNIAVNLNDSAAAVVGGNDFETLRLQSVAAYAQALRPMEIVRALKPEEKAKWAPPLYRIYLNLNMGRQFAEIEEIMKELQ